MIVAAAADGAIAGDTKRAEAVDFAIFGLEHRHRIAEQVRRDRRRAIGRELEIIGDGDLDTVGPVVTDVGGQEAAVGTVADRMREGRQRYPDPEQIEPRALIINPVPIEIGRASGRERVWQY